MKIGELGQKTGVEVATIRYYEKVGILANATRTPANYRHYQEQHVLRLRFVRGCRSLDMSLDEIRVLLRFVDAPESNCGGVEQLLDQHLGHVTARIAALTALETELRGLRRRCRKAEKAKDCGILAGIARGAARAKRSGSERHIAGTHS